MKWKNSKAKIWKNEEVYKQSDKSMSHYKFATRILTLE